MNSRERKSSQKACKIQQFRQGWVGERCEIHRLLGDSGEREIVRKVVNYNVFVQKKPRWPQRGPQIGAAEKAIYRVIERISIAIYIYIYIYIFYFLFFSRHSSLKSLTVRMNAEA